MLIELWDNYIDVWLKLINTVVEFSQDLFFWSLDVLFTAAQELLSLVATSLEGLNPLLYIDAIPESTKGMMSLVGFNECMAIIISAILIRFTLQLIPFVRWGS